MSEVRRICRNCEYLDLNTKTVIGYTCNRPNWQFRSRTASKKAPTARACKAFKPRESLDE